MTVQYCGVRYGTTFIAADAAGYISSWSSQSKVNLRFLWGWEGEKQKENCCGFLHEFLWKA